MDLDIKDAYQSMMTEAQQVFTQGVYVDLDYTIAKDEIDDPGTFRDETDMFFIKIKECIATVKVKIPLRDEDTGVNIDNIDVIANKVVIMVDKHIEKVLKSDPEVQRTFGDDGYPQLKIDIIPDEVNIISIARDGNTLLVKAESKVTED